MCQMADRGPEGGLAKEQRELRVRASVRAFAVHVVTGQTMHNECCERVLRADGWPDCVDGCVLLPFSFVRSFVRVFVRSFLTCCWFHSLTHLVCVVVWFWCLVSRLVPLCPGQTVGVQRRAPQRTAPENAAASQDQRAVLAQP